MTILRAHRTRQPVGPAQISGSRLTDGLAYLFTAGRGEFDAARGRPPIGGSRGYGPGRDGPAFVGDGASRVIDLGTLGGFARLTEGVTLMAVVEMPTLGVATSTICSFVDGSAIRSVSMHANDGSASNLVAGGYNSTSTWTAFVSPNNLVAGRRYVIIATYNANTTLQTFEVNDLATTTAAITFALGEAASIGARRTAASTYNSYFNGLIYAVGLWQRQLTRGERSALAANPWQLLEPARRLGWAFGVDVASGIYRPASDLSVTGWTFSGAGSVAAAIGEAVASDAEFATSPNLSDAATLALSAALPAGSWAVRLRPRRNVTSTGQVRVRCLNSSSVDVGGSDWITPTDAFSTFEVGFTTTALADRIRIEVQP